MGCALVIPNCPLAAQLEDHDAAAELPHTLDSVNSNSAAETGFDKCGAALIRAAF
jgi:hypothetical protein